GIIGAHCNLYIYKHTGEKLLDHNFCSIKRLPSNNNFIASRTLGNSNKFSVINEFGETKLVDYNNSTKPIYNTRIPGEISSGTLRFYQKENFDSNVETIGLIGVAGKVLIPAEYRSLHAFDNYQVARVRHHSFADILLVNYQNEQIIPPASHFGIIFNGEYFFVKPSNCPNSECEGQLLSYQGRVFETAPF
ncbi:MAG: hypothetical protein OEZ58_22355, partial [Gammaproteobacteria bacterium]|nr:hypothetical protein [Gammaproteobacteria bacterium]